MAKKFEGQSPKKDTTADAKSGVTVKKAKKSEDGEDAVTRKKYPDDWSIKVVGENPHREGSKRHEAFEAAKKSKKMAAYYASGHKIKYLKGWEDKKLIELGDPS